MTNENNFFIVGVGASAGGLEALQALFENTPADVGLAFVVVQHLSPDFKSMMPELLARHTRLAVKLAENEVEVEPNTVYLIPPRKEMIISSGKLLLKDREPTEGVFLPIDTFFRSLAQDQGARAIGVVLSGSGSDGTRGLRAIHEAGGIVIVQTEETARFTGMLRSAIDTGVADAVMPPDRISAAIHRYICSPPSEGFEEVEVSSDVMGRLLELLKRSTGIDFSSYKASTVTRRIDRRLRLSDTSTIADYLERLAADEKELNALYQDLLIGVTNFFRDPEAFARLEHDIFPRLVEAMPDNEELRIWCAACATGQEAYSLAILAHEAFARAGRRADFKVFATDVHKASLEIASAGVYGEQDLEGLSTERRSKHFIRVSNSFQVANDVRSKVVFAQHDVLRDAPFTRLDLITCRNLLIYLKPQAQRRVMSLFHFGLKSQGVLFLGASETPGELEEEFVGIDSRWKLYRKRRDRMAVGLAGLAESSVPTFLPRARPPDVMSLLSSAAHAALSKNFAPPAFVLDGELRIILSLNGASRFLKPRDGVVSHAAMELIEGELKFVLASAIRRVEAESGVSYNRVRVGDGEERVNLRAFRLELPAAERPHVLVTIEPSRPSPASEIGEGRPVDIDSLARERIENLELDLKYARENLQATVEEMEASNEELQATNEELIAANEELQSTNEELHSVNEELYTVNAEYQAKIAELTELTSDMDNLLASTQVHTIFLDRELRIRKFTPRMGDTFNLLAGDVGRRINDFAHDLNRAEIMADVQRVLDTGERFEIEVRDRRGSPYLLRILPYRQAGQIAGVVLTLIDIERIKEAERELRLSELRYRTLVRASAAVVFTLDENAALVGRQPEWAAFTGQTEEQCAGQGWIDAVHPEDRGDLMRRWHDARGAGQPIDAKIRLASGRYAGYRNCILRAAPVVDDSGRRGEWVGYVEDEHELRRAQEQLGEMTTRLHAIFDHARVGIYIKDRAGAYQLASRAFAAMMGVSPDACVGKNDFDLMPLELAQKLRENDMEVMASGEPRELEERMRTADGVRVFLSSKFPLRNGAGQVIGVGGVSVDVTERHRAAEAVREGIRRRDEFLAMLSHELRNPLAAVASAFNLLEAQHGLASPTIRRVLRRQITHLTRLLDDLLDVARMTHGTIEVRKEAVDLAAVVEEAVEAVHAARGVTVHLERPRERIPVHGDPVRLQQVCANLMSNAIRFSPDGGAVRVLLRRDGETAILRVVDHGQGIAPGDMERIFDLFYQGHSELARSRGGLGVGLSLARAIAELHGGRLEAYSDGPGKGSEFILKVPVDLNVNAAHEAYGEKADRGLTVVVIEDNDDARDMMGEWLRLEGHEVETAPDGDSGIGLIAERHPHVAIIDIGLPGRNGYEVAAEIRKAMINKPFLIALTGYGRDEDRRAAVAAGFDAHLTKPVDAAVLGAMLARIARGPAERR